MEDTYEFHASASAESYFKTTVSALETMGNTRVLDKKEYEKAFKSYALYLAKKSGKDTVKIRFEDLGKTYGNYHEVSDTITLHSNFAFGDDKISDFVIKALHTLAHEHTHRVDFQSNPTTYVKFENESGRVPRLQLTPQFAIMKKLFEEYSPAHDDMDRLAQSAYLLSDWEMLARRESLAEMDVLLAALGGYQPEKKSHLAKIFKRKPHKIQVLLQDFIAETRKNEGAILEDAHSVKGKWGFVSDKFNLALRNYATVRRPYLAVTPSENSLEEGYDPHEAYEMALRDKQRAVFENDYCTFAEVLDSPYIRRQENYDLYFNKTIELIREYAIGGEDAAYTMLRIISSPYNARSAEMLSVLYTKALPGRMLDEFHANFAKSMEHARNENYGVIAPAYVEHVHASAATPIRRQRTEELFF